MPASVQVRHDNASEDEFVRRAIDAADSNILRIALFHATGDQRLANMKVERKALRDGAFMKAVLSDEDDRRVREIAYEILSSGPVAKPTVPDEAATRALMEIFEGGIIDDEQFMLGSDELALADFPRETIWNRRPSDDVLRTYDVLIIGSGLSGLLAGIHLDRLGLPYQILDRQADIGGVWETNRYPEARVDITSFLYQFKFEKNFPWTEFYATRKENQDYLRFLAEKYKVLDKVSFGTEVISCTWNEGESRWHVLTRGPDGIERTRTCSILLSAAGQFTTPRDPEIPGLEGFAGAKFHTTRWDHDYDIAGKNVAIIGNGSTGTQLLRHVAEHAAQVTVYQRTPQWIGGAEHYREPISEETRWLFDSVPGYWNWVGYSAYSESLPFQHYQYHDPEWMEKGGRVSEKSEKMRDMLISYISSQVDGDEALIAKLTPPYAPFARRMVIDNGFYKSLTRPNVELVTDGIDRIEADGIVSTTGEKRDTDCIVLATGFEVARYFWPVKYTGRDGMTLEQFWSKDGPRAHLGVTLPHFPNFFFFYGPNSQGRFLGITSWAEIWWRYMAQVIVKMIEDGDRSFECTQEAFDAYNQTVDEEMPKLIWETEGKGGYHTRDFGRSVIHAPWTVERYNALLRHANPEDYRFAK